jgi:hypothetical protein
MKYSILTFIIGKGYEKVHEIDNKQNDVEYVLITDDPDLKSDTWKIIYDNDLLQYKTPFERCFRIRYNVFKYVTTNICVTIDGSMHVKGSLDELINKFNNEKYDICLMPHPIWNDFYTEYNAWMQMRNYPVNQAKRAINFFTSKKYDFSYKGLFQLCFSIKRRSELTNDIDKNTLESLIELSSNGEFERLDQTIFSYIMNTKFNHAKVLPVSEQVVRSNAIQWYWHNSDKPNMNIFYDINKNDIKYVFNKKVICEYI